MMISAEDCIAMCGLDHEELSAIAEHEHIPEVAASALASYLTTERGGMNVVRQMIVDDIQGALDDGRISHASELFMALRHFIEHHPDACVGLKAS